MGNFFAMLLAQFFPMLVVKAIHQVAGTTKGDDILQKNSAIIGAVIQVAQPLIVQAATTGKTIPLGDILKSIGTNGSKGFVSGGGQ